MSFPTLGGSQILTPEGFLNKIKGLSDGGDEPSDEWRVTFSRELKGKSINDDDEEKKNKIMKQTVKKWTAMMMQHRCFEIWIPLSYVLLLLLSLLYLKPKEQTVSLLYMKKMKSVMIASVCVYYYDCCRSTAIITRLLVKWVISAATTISPVTASAITACLFVEVVVSKSFEWLMLTCVWVEI